MNVELWADLGLSHDPAKPGDPTVLEAARLAEGQQYDDQAVLSMLRAAYAAGYCNALREDDPLTIREAMNARDELALRLPVG